MLPKLLYGMTTGKKEWKWKDKKKDAFNKLKNKVMNPLILAIPDSKGNMCLETNASGYTIGGVLSQQQEDNSWKPITYLSRAMNETKRNYEIYD